MVLVAESLDLASVVQVVDGTHVEAGQKKDARRYLQGSHRPMLGTCANQLW